MESYCGVLIEHFNGMLPTWLSPTQVHILTISEKHETYALEIAKSLEKLNIRIEIDTGDDTIGKKLRNHRSMRPAYLMILGDEECDKETVSYLGPDREQKNGISLKKFISNITSEINSEE